MITIIIILLLNIIPWVIFLYSYRKGKRREFIKKAAFEQLKQYKKCHTKKKP